MFRLQIPTQMQDVSPQMVPSQGWRRGRWFPGIRVSAAGSGGREFKRLVPAVPLTFPTACQQSFSPGRAGRQIPGLLTPAAVEPFQKRENAPTVLRTLLRCLQHFISFGQPLPGSSIPSHSHGCDRFGKLVASMIFEHLCVS